MLTIPLLAAVCLLAYANGANDNFKGVATLFGSDTTDYRTALAWGTLTTFLVSTTHVSVGALLGIGSITGRADLGVTRKVVLSWVVTLPCAAALAATAYALLALASDPWLPLG